MPLLTLDTLLQPRSEPGIDLMIQLRLICGTYGADSLLIFICGELLLLAAFEPEVNLIKKHGSICLKLEPR